MQILMAQKAIVARKIGIFEADRYHASSSNRVLGSDEEDETAELLRELEKIKRERAEQREQEVSQLAS